MTEGKALAKTQTKKTSLLAKMAARASLDPQVFYDTITKTVFKEAKTKEQVVALLMVAERYGLDPVTKEIFAFPDKKTNAVIPVVGVDGWNRIAQQHPQFDGIEYRWAETDIVPQGGKRCPLWCEAVVYRKDRSHPIVVREYLDECYRQTGPWQSHTKRMLRHKATIQGYRTAFGFHGIYDEDEAQRMALEEPSPLDAAEAATNAQKAREVLAAAPIPVEPANAPEPAPVTAETVVDEETGEVLEGEVEEARPEHGRVSAGACIEANRQAREQLGLEAEPETPKAKPKASKKQLEAIAAAKENGGWTDDLYKRLLAEYNVTSAVELDREQALEVVRYLMSGVDVPDDEGGE